MNPSSHDPHIAATIERALDAAGLRKDPSGSGVRATIDRALSAAGLLGPRSASPFPPAAPQARARSTVVDAPPTRGQLSMQRHVGPHGARDFGLYLPSSHDGVTPMPLLVMLHGCKQNPSDFALGTRMNEVAEARGFIVAYPAQGSRDNGGCCWNWFEGAQQQRGAPEPASIVGVVEQLVADHAVEASRVFAAGLSAGGAMALLLGHHYPEVFAGVAAHSGLPAGVARDMPSAFAAMSGRQPGTPPAPDTALPTIVFHGDADATVVPRNGHAIVEAALTAWRRDGVTLQESVRLDSHAGARLCTTTEYRDGQGRTLVESWTLHGAGHAWSGGSSAGSFTDAGGPDASAQIARFFLDR